MKIEKLIKGLLFSFNGIILLFYILNYDLSSRWLLRLLCFLLFLSVLSLGTIPLRGKVARFFENIQNFVFTIIVLFLCFEFLGWLWPNLIPTQVHKYLADGDIVKIRVKYVEYLSESPFVKFLPNKIIRSQGYFGTEDQYCYQWKTDRLGFKNTDNVANRDTEDIVVVGDSIVEGMGVATDKTFSSVLTKNGYFTYNLGVQGYAPVQYEGALRKYGVQFKPKYIIIGYSGGTYHREAYFFDQVKVIKEKTFTGGIEGFVTTQEMREIKMQGRFLFSAVYLSIHEIVDDLIYNMSRRPSVQVAEEKKIEVKNKLFEQYADDFAAFSKPDRRIEEMNNGSKTWDSTLKTFDRIIEMSNSIHSQVILLYLPHRPQIYFPFATGLNLPENAFEKVESSLLNKYAENRHIAYLDPADSFRKYVQNLHLDSAAVTDLPFLEIDGHPNSKGHEVIANEILEYLKAHS